jgi:putative intracellular protease/amidase
MGVSMNPTMTFANVPDNLDVLFVPGGFGTTAAMQDEEIMRSYPLGHPQRRLDQLIIRLDSRRRNANGPLGSSL